MKRKNRFLQPQPGNETAHESVLFAKTAQCQNRSPAEQPKVADLGNNPPVNRALHDPVKSRRSEPLKDAIALSGYSLGRHDIVALLVELHHLRKDFRRVLQVGIHDDDCVAGSEIQSRCDRSLLTKIAAEIQNLDR